MRGVSGEQRLKPDKSKGVKLEQFKQPALGNKLMRLTPPDIITVPLYSFDRSSMLPVARAGETVSKFSVLARSKAGTSWIVTPESGKLLRIERVNHPIMGSVLCAYIRTDSRIPPVAPVPHNPSEMTREGLLHAITQAAIIDEADGIPVHLKLRRAVKNGTLLLVADCLDDSPYVSSALKTISDYGDQCADGASIVLKLLGGGKTKLAVFDPGGLDLEALLDKFGFISTAVMSGGYPSWFSFEEKYCTEKYIRIGVQALRAISKAVRYGLAQSDFIMTVAGDCISAPCNVVVTTGTPVSYVLESVGMRSEPRRIILGDMMTGTTIDDPDTALFPGIRAIIASSQDGERRAETCIGCGRCTEVCPKRLFPSEAHRMLEQKRPDIALIYGAKKCTGCGACSAVCPCGIELCEEMLELKYPRET